MLWLQGEPSLLSSRYYDNYSHNFNGNFMEQIDEDLKEIQEIEKRYPALYNPILVDWNGPEYFKESK